MHPELLLRIEAESERRRKRKKQGELTETEAARIYKGVIGPPILLDWKNPNYAPIIANRERVLDHLRKNPLDLIAFKVYYKENPWDFINDWGWTFEPRNLERKLPAWVPFILFPKQREWTIWVIAKWKAQEPGLTEKSRDGGLSWLAVSLASTLCLFYQGMVVGFGSRKAEYVDHSESPKALFWKARKFLERIPPEFNGGWNPKTDAPHMRLNFRATGSYITGESGDGIGRGDRTSIYFVDEAAHLERPILTEQSLSQTTNCRIDVSSVNGTNNPFAEKAISGKIEKFIFDWRDDPRKDHIWYQKKVAELDPVTVAQEIDRNYGASIEGIIIPSEWVRACIDAHKHLGFIPTGARRAALDVADEGVDLNALVGGHGVFIEFMEEWAGKFSDIYATTERAFKLCDDQDYHVLKYDADGLGAAVRGDSRKINEERKRKGLHELIVSAYRGSAGVVDPEKEDVKGRLNEDYFQNQKAQEWNSFRMRVHKTFRAVTQGASYKPDEIVSFAGTMPLLSKLITEISQPTWEANGAGKMVVNKKPDNSRSPNLADAAVIYFSRAQKQALVISAGVIEAMRLKRQQQRSL